MFDIYAPSGESLGRKRGVSVIANWIGPSEDKVSMAFSIIWAVVCLSQLALLFQRLRKISPETSRKPFVFLGISVLCLMVHYIVYAIFARTVWEYEIPIDTRNAISQTASFFYLINVALLPGLCLYLIHTRGNILSKTFTPITSQKWKKIFDFVMVGLLFVLSLAYFAFLAHDMNAVNHQEMSFDTWRARAGHLSRLNHATIAVKILIYIDVIVSSIVIFVQARKRQTAHAVIKRLTIGVSPMFLIMSIESVVYPILAWNNSYYMMAVSLIHIIVDGLGRIVIAWVVISTMTITEEHNQFGPSDRGKTPSFLASARSSSTL